ncbi:MAG: transglycosylase SLT domain-containing protein [Pseudomonadota bacterium]
MIQCSSRPNFLIFLPLLNIAFVLSLIFSSIVFADYPLLVKIITAHNLKAMEEDFIEGSFRGEAGLLRMRPEIAKSFGIKVFIDQDYLDSRELFEKADKSLHKAKMLMATQRKEGFPGEHEERVAQYFLEYKGSLKAAEKKLSDYHTKVNPNNDDRLDEDICIRVMNQLLQESLKVTKNQLRDALGYFYNLCQGMNEDSHFLTSENVHFVNHVFRQFTQGAAKETLNAFDLDRDHGGRSLGTNINWGKILGDEGSQYIPIVETALASFDDGAYQVDPLLFMALMRRESNFDHLAVSPVGAAGLTQIMPKTARELGMKNVYTPDYFYEAIVLLRQERKTRREAFDALFQINENNSFQYASLARKLMQNSLFLKQKKERLFAQYRQELVQNNTDDRLKPEKAIEHGLKYFAQLMKMQKGDISLALASYNAGPHRVSEYNGIPPFDETVHFRNRILKIYRDYMRKAKETM